jgi:hypothetical protein
MNGKVWGKSYMKHVKTKRARVIGTLLPYNSLKGAKAKGPVANPQIYRVNPNKATTFPTPNSKLTGSTAAEYTELPHEICQYKVKVRLENESHIT